MSTIDEQLKEAPQGVVEGGIPKRKRGEKSEEGKARIKLAAKLRAYGKLVMGGKLTEATQYAYDKQLIAIDNLMPSGAAKAKPVEQPAPEMAAALRASTACYEEQKAKPEVEQGPREVVIDYVRLAAEVAKHMPRAVFPAAMQAPIIPPKPELEWNGSAWVPVENQKEWIRQTQQGGGGSGRFSEHTVAGNNPVNRILSQLEYPKDKEGQVVSMIAANMAPSVNFGDPEGELNKPLQEGAVLAHMREYCRTLAPELPKTRLEPMYKLNGAQA